MKIEFELPEEIKKEFVSFAFLTKQSIHQLGYQMFLLGLSDYMKQVPFTDKLRDEVIKELQLIELLMKTKLSKGVVKN